jgi:hypothetical protein
MDEMTAWRILKCFVQGWVPRTATEVSMDDKSELGQIEITFHGQVISKKNLYMPTIAGGTVIFIKNSALQAKLDTLACQIPGDYRDIKLENPDIRVEMTVAHIRGDQDGAYTTLLDLLVDAGVLYNDNIARCNGRKILEPCVISDHWKTVVTLTPRGSSPSRRIRRSV